MFYIAIHSSAINEWQHDGVSEYEGATKLAQGVRNGDALLLFTWFPDTRTASIKALGWVEESDQLNGRVLISWKEVCFDLHPGSGGFRYWRDKWFLPLEPARVSAYGLKDRFATTFNDDVFLRSRVNGSFILRKNVDKDIASIIPEAGFVYLMFDGELWKIGKAVNIASRRSQIEREIGKQLDLLHSIRSNDYSRAEAEMHFRYRHCRIRGEWFDLARDELTAFCEIDVIEW